MNVPFVSVVKVAFITCLEKQQFQGSIANSRRNARFSRLVMKYIFIYYYNMYNNFVSTSE